MRLQRGLARLAPVVIVVLGSRMGRAQPAGAVSSDAAPAPVPTTTSAPDDAAGAPGPEAPAPTDGDLGNGDGDDGDGDGKHKHKDKDKDKGNDSEGAAGAADTNVTVEHKLARAKKKKKAGSKYTPHVAGYLQVRYRNPIDTNNDHSVKPDNFRLDRVRLKVNGKITKRIGYSVEFDPRAPDITGILRDAYISAKYIPHHEIRVGQQKTQFGYENVESSTKLYYVDRAKVSDRIARGITGRDIGLGLIGEIPIACGFSVEDAVTLVNGAGANAQNDDNEGKDVWGRLGGRYENGALDLDLRLGGSLGIGDRFNPGTDPISPIDDYRYDFLRLGTDVQADTKWAFVSAEYVWARDTDQQTKAKVTAKGYYAMIAGKTPWRVGPMVRYDTFADTYKRWTFGAYYGKRGDPLRAMINYEHRKGKDDRLILWAQAKF